MGRIPVQAFIAADLGATAAQIAVLTGCFSVGQLVGSLIMGKLSDHIGRKSVVILSLASSTVSYILAAFADTLWLLFVARGFCGLCGGTMPVVQAMVLDVVSDPEERPQMLAMCGAAAGLGFVVGPVIGGVCAELFGLSSGYILCAILGGIGTILALVYIQETNTHAKGEAEETIPESPAGGFGLVVWTLCLTMFINSCAFATSSRLWSTIRKSVYWSDSPRVVLWCSQLQHHGINGSD